jgi:hypothetical protein
VIRADPSILDVEPHCEETHWAAVAVIAWVADELEIRAQLPGDRAGTLRPDELEAIVGFQDLLASIMECAVIEKESGAAGGQVIAMGTGEAIARDRDA